LAKSCWCWYSSSQPVATQTCALVVMDLSTDLWLTCTEVTATFNVQLDEHTQLIPTF
jgi:hypothetical protein